MKIFKKMKKIFSNTQKMHNFCHFFENLVKWVKSGFLKLITIPEGPFWKKWVKKLDQFSHFSCF